MARKSIEDVMNEIEDFLNSCKTTALSSNKVVVPRDEFDELFGDLKVKIPAEIDRCKKIMRNKDAILMDARKNADELIAKANQQVSQMVSETQIVTQANQKAYEIVEMARVQANEILSQAVSEANEIRLGSMQYTNDIMLGIRNYVEATMEAERANYENLIETLNNEYIMANANLEEIQSQIVEFTGNPDSVKKAPQMKQTPQKKEEAKSKTSVVQKVKQAVGVKEDKQVKEAVKETKPAVDIPDLTSKGAKVVPNETPLQANVSLKSPEPKDAVKKNTVVPQVKQTADEPKEKVIPIKENLSVSAAGVQKQESVSKEETADDSATKKVKKKIVKRRNPVVHTPQTAQETIAKTLEAAANAKVDKTVYKANGEQSREVPTMEGRVKRGPRVGRGVVEQPTTGNQNKGSEKPAEANKSLGVLDDFSMEKKM